MCGIAGFVGNFPPELCARMARAMAHRGPDGEGVWHGEGVGLAHRRLSIIDLSEAAAQPMEGVNGRYVTVFNGEIYNFRELTTELEGAGYTFNKNSDTAILAPLYDHHGPAMVQKLSGIFAFAIWDRKTQTLFAARDHAGTKPFYLAQTGEGLLFASEIKSLLRWPHVNKALDEAALFSYLTYLWSPGENTPLRGVKKLLPGHSLLLKAGKEPEIHRWYTLPLPQKNKKGEWSYNTSKTPEDLACLLDDVVAAQMVSDVPVGAFLSGGVDSSAIVASMRRRFKGPINTFCISFKQGSMADEGFSEDIDYAKKVAKSLDVTLNEVRVGANCLNELPAMIYALEEPQADPAPLYVRAIARQAREMGIKVLMSGTGGDDVFSGYRRHQSAVLMNKLRPVPALVRRAGGGLLGKTPVRGALGRRLTKLGYILGAAEEEALLRAFHYTPPAWLVEILSPDMAAKFNKRGRDHLENSLAESRGQHTLNRMLHLEWQGFLPDHNLNYTDKLGMAESVEIRVPLLDPLLFDFAADLPVEKWKCNGRANKIILKEAMRGRLPERVLKRSKAGFGAPVRLWLATGARDMLEDLLFSGKLSQRGLFNETALRQLQEDTLSGVRDGSYTLLAVMVLELWLRQFADAAVPAEMAAA